MAESNQGFAAVVAAIERLRDTAYNNTGARVSVSRARLLEERKQTDEIKKLAGDNRKAQRQKEVTQRNKKGQFISADAAEKRERTEKQPRDRRGRFTAESLREEIESFVVEIKNLSIRGENVTLIANKVNLTSGENAKSTEMRLAKAIADQIRSKPLTVQTGFMDKLSAGFAFAFSQQFSKGFGRGTKKNTGINTEDIGYGVGNFVTNPKGATKEGVQFRRESRLDDSVRMAREQAKKENVTVDPNKPNFFVAGGSVGTGGRGGAIVKTKLEDLIGKDNANIQSVRTSNTDPAKSMRKDPLGFIIEQNTKALNNLVFNGQNQDAIELAAKVIAAREKDPNANIQLVGHSSGGQVVEEAIAILIKAGITDVMGTGLGTPDIGLGYKTQGKFKNVVGKTDNVNEVLGVNLLGREGKDQDLDNVGELSDMSEHFLTAYLRHPEVVKRIAPEQKTPILKKLLSQQIQGLVDRGNTAAGMSDSNPIAKELKGELSKEILEQIKVGQDVIANYGDGELQSTLNQYQQLAGQLAQVFPELSAEFTALAGQSTQSGQTAEELQAQLRELQSRIRAQSGNTQSIPIPIDGPTPQPQETPIADEAATMTDRLAEWVERTKAEAVAMARQNIAVFLQSFDNFSVQEKQNVFAGFSTEINDLAQQYRAAVEDGDRELAAELGGRLIQMIPQIREIYDQLSQNPEYATAFNLRGLKANLTSIETEVTQGSRASGRSRAGLLGGKDGAAGIVPEAEEMANRGDNAAAGFLGALNGALNESEQGGRNLGDYSLKGLDESLDMRSPSKEMEKRGEMAGQGFEIGLVKSLKEAGDSAKAEIDKLKTAIAKDLEYFTAIKLGDTTKAQGLVDQAAKDSGYNVTDVLAGLKSQAGEALQPFIAELESAFTSAGGNSLDSLIGALEGALGQLRGIGGDVGESLAQGTEDSLQIDSPSKVYKAIGQDIIAGLEQGMDGFEGTLEEKEKILETYVKSVIELIYSFKKVTGKPMGEADAVRKLFQEIGQEGTATPGQLEKAKKYFPQVERLPDESPGVALYNPKQNKIKIKQGRDTQQLSDDLMHEYTHAIQARFGVGMRFATTPADFFPKTAISPKGEKHLGDRRVDQASDASANHLMGAFNITPEQGRRHETQFNHVKRRESEAYANELGVGGEQKRRGFFKAEADEVAAQIKAAKAEAKKAAEELRQAAEQQAQTVKEAGATVGKSFADGVEEGKQTLGDRLNGFLNWLEGIPVIGQLVKWGRQLAGFVQGLFNKKEGTKPQTTPKPTAPKPQPVQTAIPDPWEDEPKVTTTQPAKPAEVKIDPGEVSEQIQEIIEPVTQIEVEPETTPTPTPIEVAPVEVAQEIQEAIAVAVDPQKQADRWLAYITQWAKGIGTAFNESLGTEIAELKASGKNIAQELRGKIDQIGDGLEQRKQQFRQAIADGNTELSTALGTQLVEQSEQLRVLYKRMAENVKFFEGRGMWRDQSAEMTKVQKEAIKGYPNLKGRAKTGAWQAIAGNTSDGFTQEMETQLTDAEQSGYDLGESAIAGAKKALGIKSPSTEFVEIARNVIEGWNNGLDALGDEAGNNVRRFVRNVQDSTGMAIDEIEQGIGQIFTAIGDAFPMLKTFKGAILAIGAGFIIDAALESLVGLFTQFAIGAFDSVVAAESLTRSFLSLTGSSSKARQSMAYAAQTAQELGIDLQTAEEAYKGMIATTRGTALEGLQTDQMFKAFSATAAARGLSGEEQGRMFAALQQALAKGKLSAEEVRGQLGEIAALDFQGTVARSMGISVAQLDEAMSSGSIMAADVLPKVAAQYQAENAIVANSSDTTAQAMTRYSNALELLRRSMGEWFAETKFIFNAAASGIELLTKVMPGLVQWVSALALVLAWNSVSLFAALLKIPIVSKIAAIALRELAKAIGFIISGPGLKMLATYAAQIILIQFAFDAVSAAVNTTQNRFTEYAKAIETTRKAVEAMEAAQAKLNKTQSQAGKNLPTTGRDVVTDQTWKPFGIETGLNLEPIRQLDRWLTPEPYKKNVVTLGEKQMNDFKIMASENSDLVNRVYAEGSQVVGEVEKITEIDRQLAIVRSRRFENIRGDKQAYEQSVAAEKELLAKREEVLSYTSTYQTSLDSAITSVERRLADIEAMKARGGITQDEAEYQTTMAEAELSDLKKARTEFEKLSNSLTQAVNGLEREMRDLNEQAAAFNESLERTATNNRVAFLRQAAASGTGSTIRGMGLSALADQDNQARVGFLRDRLSTQEMLLSDPEFAAIADELQQQAAALGTDLENTATLDRIIAENRDGTTTQVATLIKEILDTKTQLGQAEEAIAQSLVDQGDALFDLNRTIADFFQQLTQQFEEARIELDRVKTQLKYGGLKQRLRQALVPGSNSFLNGVISSIEGLFDQAATVLDGALGRRSGRLAWAGEKYSMENQMVDFARSVNGATEALLGFRQALGGGSPARGSGGGQNFVQPARQGQTGAVRYTAPSRPNPTPPSVRSDFAPPSVGQGDRPLPVPPPTSNQFVTPAPQPIAPPPTVQPAPQSSRPADLLQQAMENNANGRSLTAPIESVPVVQPPPTPPTPQPSRQLVEQIQSNASNLLRLPAGYESVNKLTGMIQNLPFFNPNNRQGIAAMVINAAIAATELLGKNTRLPVNQFATKKGGAGGIHTGYGQYNPRYHPGALGSVENMASYTGQIITGQRKLPNSKGQTNFAAQLVQEVRAGMMRNGQDLINFLNRGGAASLAGVKGGSNWEGLINGWSRNPGLADALVDYLNQQLGQVQSSLNFGVNPGEMELAQTAQLGKWLGDAIDGAGNFLEGITNRKPKTLLQLARKFARDNQQFLDGVDVITASQQLIAGKFKVKSLQTGFNNLAKSQGFAVQVQSQPTRQTQTGGQQSRPATNPANTATPMAQRLNLAKEYVNFYNKVHKLNLSAKQLGMASKALAEFRSSDKKLQSQFESYVNLSEEERQSVRNSLQAAKTKTESDMNLGWKTPQKPTPQAKPLPQPPKRDYPLGTVLNGKLWAGPTWGWQSKAAYQKIMAGQSIQSAQSPAMGSIPHPPNTGTLPPPPPLGVPSLPPVQYGDPIIQQAQGLQGQYFGVREQTLDLQDQIGQQDLGNFLLEADRVEQEYLRGQGDNLRQLSNTLFESNNSMADLLTQYGPQTLTSQAEADARQANAALRNTYNQLFEQRRAQEDELRTALGLVESNKQNIATLRATPATSPEEAVVNQRKIDFMENQNIVLQRDVIPSYQQALKETASQELMMQKAIATMEEWLAVQQKQRELAQQGEMIALGAAIAQATYNEQLKLTNELQAADNEFETRSLEESRKLADNPELLEQTIQGLATIRDRRKQAAKFEFESVLRNRQIELLGREIALNQAKFNGEKVYSLSLLQADLEGQNKKAEIMEKVTDLQERQNQLAMTDLETAEQKRQIEFDRINMMLGFKQADRDLASRSAENRANLSRNIFWATDTREQNAVANRQLEFERRAEEIRQTQPADRQESMIAQEAEILAQDLELIDREFRDLSETIGDNVGNAFMSFYDALVNGENALKAFGQALFKSIGDIGSQMMKQGMDGFMQTIFGKGGWIGGLFGAGAEFSSGGYTGDGGKYEAKGVVHGGEFVINKESTRKIGLPALMSANTLGQLPGYYQGGYVGIESRLLSGLNSTRIPSISLPTENRRSPVAAGPVSNTVTVNINDRESRFYKQAPTIAREMANKLRG